MKLPEYEVHALRYASRVGRARENFLLQNDIHDGPLGMDYFVWLIRGHGRTVVVDTGFGEEVAARRGRKLLRHPVQALAAIGVDAAEVPDVVFTHLHFDHSGNAGCFPRARFHVQDAEMAFATGRCMCHRVMNSSLEVEDVVGLVRNVYAGRVEFHDGSEELAPGIVLHRIPGHTAGTQAVRVHTARGWVVLASDCAHYYANMDLDNPFPIVLNVGEALEAPRRLLRLADSPDHIVPGHDPEVLRLYQHVAGSGGEIACLHLPPRVARTNGQATRDPSA